MEALRPNEQRAKTAIILIWIVMSIETISFISDCFQCSLLCSAANGLGISPEDASANDARQGLIAILYGIVYIVSVITFIMWFRRAYFNLHIKVDSLTRSEGWAAGCWFVPIASLWYPYQIMKELYIETENLLSKKIQFYTPQTKISTLGWWWTIWIINNLVAQFAFRYSRNADDLDELIISTLASIFSAILGIPLAIITVNIIKKYSKLEKQMAELID